MISRNHIEEEYQESGGCLWGMIALAVIALAMIAIIIIVLI